MKYFSIKTLLIQFFLPIIFFIPLLFSTITANLLENVELSKKDQMNNEFEKDINWVNQKILASPQQWENPQWQQTIIIQLKKHNNLYIRLFNKQNELVFLYPLQDDLPTKGILYEEYPVYQKGTFKGVVYVGQDTPKGSTTSYLNIETLFELLPFFIWLIIFVIIVTITLLFLKRHVLKPLTSLHKATEKISKKQFDYSLSKTKVLEIAEVLQAFSLMKDTLQQSLVQQAKLEEERKIFISSISHDLRTPLFSIRGALQAIKEGINPNRNERYLEICQKKSDLLDSMIEELLLYSKLDHHTFHPNNETIDFSHLIKEILEDLQWIQKEKNIGVMFRSSQHYLIQGDKTLLQRACSNIILNAFQYSPNNSEVMISVNREGKNILISIADSGPGIKPEDMPLIFSPLYRAECSRNKNIGGSGLGLAISKRIVQAHQGEITVQNSKKNGGAIFFIHLPINPFIED